MEKKNPSAQVAKLSTVDVQAGHQAGGTTTEEPGWRHGATKDLKRFKPRPKQTSKVGAFFWKKKKRQKLGLICKGWGCLFK